MDVRIEIDSDETGRIEVTRMADEFIGPIRTEDQLATLLVQVVRQVSAAAGLDIEIRRRGEAFEAPPEFCR